VAIALIFGRLTADDYEDRIAADARIDSLREKMEVSDNRQFSRDYLDPDKRAIGNAVQVFFRDGGSTGRVAVDYPIGHRRRRDEGVPLLLEKFRRSLEGHFEMEQVEKILFACDNHARLEEMPVNEFSDLWVK